VDGANKNGCKADQPRLFRLSRGGGSRVRLESERVVRFIRPSELPGARGTAGSKEGGVIANHIIIRRPAGSTTVFGPIAHRVFFRAREEYEALHTDPGLAPGRHIFHPQIKAGWIHPEGFEPFEWTIGPASSAEEIRDEDLVVDIEEEPSDGEKEN
jgi:hypothetical protein